MQYFLTEKQRKLTHSTCYHEFFKGTWDLDLNGFWNDDSLFIEDDEFCRIGMDRLIEHADSNYDYFGETEITQAHWSKIVTEAKNTGGELWDAILEVVPWAENCYGKHNVITILGM